MRYVLMQAPKTEDEYSSQIEIIDNSGAIGKRKVENLVAEGYECVGTIDSGLRAQQLRSGFAHDAQKQISGMHDLFLKISEMADSHMGLIC